MKHLGAVLENDKEFMVFVMYSDTAVLTNDLRKRGGEGPGPQEILKHMQCGEGERRERLV
jgi:hypothetical protein